MPGAIVGGLIIGASEKLAEVYVGPFVGGGIESWFPYVLALLFLLVRPEACSGRSTLIASKKPPPHPFTLPHRATKERQMFYREAGQFKASYQPTSRYSRSARTGVAVGR